MNFFQISILIGIILITVVFFVIIKQDIDSKEDVVKKADTKGFTPDHIHLRPLKKLEIQPGEVVQKIKNREDIVLLDVRRLDEYEEVHLENAVLIPIDELSIQTLKDADLEDREREIIIYCRSGARSERAHTIMNKLGYINIKSVAGGMNHWQEDKYPFID